MTSRRFDLFIVDVEGTISHKSGDGDQWPNDWTPLPGSTRFQYDPVAIAHPPFRLNVFAVGADHHLYHRWREGSASDWQPHEGWECLGGECTSKPLAVVGRGVLHVLVLGTDRKLWVTRWDGRSWTSTTVYASEGCNLHLPTAHVIHGGVCFYTTGSDPDESRKWGDGLSHWNSDDQWLHIIGARSFPPNSTRWGFDGRLLVRVGADSALWQKWTDSRGRDWEPSDLTDPLWDRIGGDSYQGIPELVVREDNQVSIFAIRTNGIVEHRHGAVPIYSDPVDLGGNVGDYDITARSSNGNRVDLFIVCKEGRVYHKIWNAGQWEPSRTAYFDLGGSSYSSVAVAHTRNPWNPGENSSTSVQPGTYFIQSVSRPGYYLAHQNDGTVLLQETSSPSTYFSLMWTFSSGEDGDYIITASDDSDAVLHVDDSYRVLCSPTTGMYNTWNIDVRQPDTYVIGTSTGAFAIDLIRGDQVVALMRTGRLQQRWRFSA